MVAPLIAAGITAAGSLAAAKMSSDATESAADKAAAASAPVPISTPLYYTGINPDGRVIANLTNQGQGLLGGALGDYQSIPLSSITQPGFSYGQSDRDLLGRADQIYGRSDQFFDRSGQTFNRANATFDRSGQFFDQASNTFSGVGGFLDRSANMLDRAPSYFDRADVAFNRAQTPEASLNFLERAFGPQLARDRAAQENRLLNQGLLGSTTGSLQTEALRRGQQGALLEGALQQQQFQGQLGQTLSGVGTNVGNLGTDIGTLGINLGNLGVSQGNLGATIGNLGVNQGNLGISQAEIGRGLLGSALDARKLYSTINLGRQGQNLAEREFLNQARSGSLSTALGLLEAPGGGASVTLGGQGNAGAAAQAAALGAQGQQQMAGNIAAGLQSIGLGLAGMQEQPSTSNLSTGTYASGSFLPGGGTGFSGTSSFSVPSASGFSGTTPFLLPNR